MNGPPPCAQARRTDRLVPVRPRPGGRTTLSVLLGTAVVVAWLRVDTTGGLLHPGGGAALARIARSLLQPDLSPAFLVIVAEAAALTLAYAVAGLTVALVIGLPGAVVVSGALAARPAVRRLSTVGARGVFGALRASHELVWALLFLTILGPTPLAGVLAIGIPYGATVARVLGEHLQNTPPGPLEALASAGAGRGQQLVYVRLPMAGADLLAYVAYRFECAVRAAAVLSFIGLGGIGYRLTLSLHDLRFDRAWTLIAVLVLLIAGIDTASSRLRRGLT